MAKTGTDNLRKGDETELATPSIGVSVEAEDPPSL
jgi:hypothetical protein